MILNALFQALLDFQVEQAAKSTLKLTGEGKGTPKSCHPGDIMLQWD